ncbi:MAG TPA: hypothetical protein VGY99_28760 [Candidatus Binataceae bacterium]|jgi:hypothetical protein|nr:hypothetical protein [Candidatus Binataceae bacterium]
MGGRAAPLRDAPLRDAPAGPDWPDTWKIAVRNNSEGLAPWGPMHHKTGLLSEFCPLVLDAVAFRREPSCGFDAENEGAERSIDSAGSPSAFSGPI